jgi:hypothetical protein
MEPNKKLMLLIGFTVWVCCYAGVFAYWLFILRSSYKDKE